MGEVANPHGASLWLPHSFFPSQLGFDFLRANLPPSLDDVSCCIIPSPGTLHFPFCICFLSEFNEKITYRDVLRGKETKNREAPGDMA